MVYMYIEYFKEKGSTEHLNRSFLPLAKKNYLQSYVYNMSANQSC